VSFFADVPEPEPPREPDYRPATWLTPPDNVMPAAVALDAVVMRGDGLAVWVGTASAYPEGVLLDVVIMRRRPPGARVRQPFFMQPGHPGGPRVGVGFADGRKAVLDGPAGPQPEGSNGPTLMSSGGGGTDRSWHARVWLWPLPPEGSLTLAFAWPDEGVDEATVQVDATAIVRAAARAVELWPDERPASPG
jgi:hypothetical protein